MEAPTLRGLMVGVQEYIILLKLALSKESKTDSRQWNPVVWAEQGYVVVTPNITGSMGWGLDMAAG